MSNNSYDHTRARWAYDLEMLELAAFAAGIKPAYFDGNNLGYDTGRGIGAWNPLTDDADAFRLAIKLKLIVEPPRPDGYAHVYQYSSNLQISERRSTMKPDAELAATRRAIVRAAAELGRRLK